MNTIHFLLIPQSKYCTIKELGVDMITNDKESIKPRIQNGELLRVIRLSEIDVRNGKYRSASEVFSDLRRKLNIWKTTIKKQ